MNGHSAKKRDSAAADQGWVDPVTRKLEDAKREAKLDALKAELEEPVDAARFPSIEEIRQLRKKAKEAQ